MIGHISRSAIAQYQERLEQLLNERATVMAAIRRHDATQADLDAIQEQINQLKADARTCGIRLI